MTTEEILDKQWFVVINDLIGGLAITIEQGNGYLSSVEDARGAVVIADMIGDRKLAEYICDLHNRHLHPT